MARTNLRLTLDPKNGTYTAVVELPGSLGPRHEEEHARIRDEVLELLLDRGIAPERVQVVLQRTECETATREVVIDNPNPPRTLEESQ